MKVSELKKLLNTASKISSDDDPEVRLYIPAQEEGQEEWVAELKKVTICRNIVEVVAG